MRPILLGCAAVAMFIGGVMMAPLTSDLAVSVCVGEVRDSASSCGPVPAGPAPQARVYVTSGGVFAV